MSKDLFSLKIVLLIFLEFINNLIIINGVYEKIY